MNLMARNFAVVLSGAVSSVLTAAILIFLEARSGQALFGYTAWTYVPAGAIAAGFVGAIGYLTASLLLRARPGLIVLLPMVAVAAGTAFLADSAEFALFMDGKGATRDVASFAKFLGTSLLRSPLKFWPESGPGDGAAAKAALPEPQREMPQLSNDSNAAVQGIGAGIQNMLSSQDPNKTVAASPQMAQIGKIGKGLQSLGSGLDVHGDAMQLLVLQAAGFALGGLVVFGFLRSLPFCGDCNLFMSKKGAQTRYFMREQEAKSSVDGFLEIAKSRRLQESIEAHSGKGSGARNKFSVFCSTIEVRRCKQCQVHRLNFTARRKSGGSWKDVSVLGYSARSLEPLELVKV
jgi:hypothetical protein